MSTPTVMPSDLETFLGMAVGTIDANRAAACLQDAQNLCESIVFPLPSTANVVVKIVAARGYVNPQGMQSETVGPYRTEWGTSTGTGAASLGPYLTRGDKATLRRLAGGSSAFSIETLPPGVNAVQTITVTATGGMFLLSLTGSPTAPIAWNALSGAVQSALEALSIIGQGNVSVTGNGPYIVTFINHLGTSPIPTMGADGSLLTGPTPSVSVVTTTRGIFKPGQGLSPWDKDYLASREVIGGGSGGEYY